MADKSSGAGAAAGRAPAADQVRNVVLVGHSGTGKSSLVEALLAATGTIQRPGSIEEGTTVSDFDETEVRQQRSVNLTLAPIIHNGIKVNLLDTPGYADRADDGDGVGRYRGTREDLARGGEQARHGGPQHVQHGRPILPPG